MHRYLNEEVLKALNEHGVKIHFFEERITSDCTRVTVQFDRGRYHHRCFISIPHWVSLEVDNENFNNFIMNNLKEFLDYIDKHEYKPFTDF